MHRDSCVGYYGCDGSSPLGNDPCSRLLSCRWQKVNNPMVTSPKKTTTRRAGKLKTISLTIPSRVFFTWCLLFCWWSSWVNKKEEEGKGYIIDLICCARGDDSCLILIKYIILFILYSRKDPTIINKRGRITTTFRLLPLRRSLDWINKEGYRNNNSRNDRWSSSTNWRGKKRS